MRLFESFAAGNIVLSLPFESSYTEDISIDIPEDFIFRNQEELIDKCAKYSKEYSKWYRSYLRETKIEQLQEYMDYNAVAKRLWDVLVKASKMGTRSRCKDAAEHVHALLFGKPIPNMQNTFLMFLEQHLLPWACTGVKILDKYYDKLVRVADSYKEMFRYKDCEIESADDVPILAQSVFRHQGENIACGMGCNGRYYMY